MPIFEYVCECGYKFEVLKYNAEESESAQCPKCGKTANQIVAVPAWRNPNYGIQG